MRVAIFRANIKAHGKPTNLAVGHIVAWAYDDTGDITYVDTSEGSYVLEGNVEQGLTRAVASFWGHVPMKPQGWDANGAPVEEP